MANHTLFKDWEVLFPIQAFTQAFITHDFNYYDTFYMEITQNLLELEMSYQYFLFAHVTPLLH